MNKPTSFPYFLRLVAACLLILVPAGAQTTIGGTISDGAGGPLVAGTYHVTSGLTVASGSTLTINPGAILKFGNTTLTVNGTLIANGAIFTSANDESVGIDVTPNVTVGGPGQWNRVQFNSGSDASVLTNCTIRYAGSIGLAMVRCGTTSPSFVGTTLSDALVAAIDLQSSSLATFDGCTFANNARTTTGVTLDAAAGFTNNTATGNALGDSLRVLGGTVGGAVTWTKNNSLNQSGVFVVEASVTVGLPDVFTLESGCILKWSANHSMRVDGTLTTNGTATEPVVITHIEDDEFGGDSSNNGATTAAKGSWNRVDFRTGSDASQLTHTRIRYAGSVGLAIVYFPTPANPTFLHCVIERGLFDGVDLLSGDSLPTFTACAFDENNGVAVDNVRPQALPGFSGNTAANNGERDTIDVNGDTINAPLTLDPDQSLNGDGVFTLQGSLTIAAGATLTLNPGVIVKWLANHTFTVNGNLQSLGTAANPVIFTDIADDTAGGDTNKDGNLTAPSAGHWNRADFGDLSDASVLENTWFRYAGSIGLATVRLLSADITMIDCRITDGGNDALDLNLNSYPTVEGCRFLNCNQYAIDSVPWEAVPGFRHNTASGNGQGDYMRITASNVNGNVSVFPFNYPGDALVVASGTVIAASGSLTLNPGVIWKMSGNHLIDTDGPLFARGTGARPVIITHIRDDAFGGDTNKDGNATAPAPGNWNRIDLSGTSPSVLEHVRVRYAGGAGVNGIRCLDPSTLRSVRAERCLGVGFQLEDLGANPVNLVAYQNTGDGIRIGASLNTAIVHATCVENGGDGIERLGGSAATVINSISWNNGAMAFNGFSSGAVTFSCGDSVPAGGTGNITSNPLFLDQPAGNFNLKLISPCINVAEIAAGFATVKDFAEHSRLLDPFMVGNTIPDMGAHEFFPYVLLFSGEPQLGTNVSVPVSFVVTGLPGSAILFAGILDGGFFFPGLGFMTAGDINNIAILSLNLAVDAPYSTLIPNDPALDGFEFAVQAYAKPSTLPGTVGAMTNVQRSRIFR